MAEENDIIDSDSESDYEDEERVRMFEQQRQAFLARFLRTVFYERPVAEANGNEELIQGLKEKDALTDKRVEEALIKIPRGYFVTPDLKDEAYSDRPLRFSKMGFNISAPHMYAMCLCKLDIQPGNYVLDIGSGSGHFTILAGYLTGPAGLVHGLDLHDYIIEFSKNNTSTFLREKGNDLGITFDHVEFIKRNCFLPSADDIKYDRIHVGACCPEAHIQFLYDMLKPGGIVVTPFGDKLIKATKIQEGQVHVETLVPVRYSDLILPSDAEIKEAQKAIAIAKANKIVVPAISLHNQFATCFGNSACSNIAFIVEGKKVLANSLLLKIRSQFFGELLVSRELDKEYTINDCSYNIFIEILKYIYTDTCEINSDNADELLRRAKRYNLLSLEAKLEGRENGHTIIDDLSKLINNPLFSDVVFVVEEIVIPAHKLILEVRSEHFRKLFSSGLRESQSNRIDIIDCSPAVFLDVLQFIYTDHCKVNEDNCITLLEQANFFQLDRLKAICEQFWFHNININNAASVLEVAERFNATQLKDFAMEFIFNNIKDVVKTPAFQELDQGLISSILIASVERGK